MRETKEKIKEVLQQFDITQSQINILADAILEYSCLNSSMEVLAPEICPKCGAYHPHVVKGGRSSTGKQMYPAVKDFFPRMATLWSIPIGTAANGDN